jgi:hypothetical protein
MRVRPAICLVIAALAAPGLAQAQTPGLEFVGPDDLSVSLSGDKATSSVWLRNTASKATKVAFTALVENGDGVQKRLRVTPTIDSTLEPAQVRRFQLTFRGSDITAATGELVAAHRPSAQERATGTVTWPGVAGTTNLTVKPTTVADRGVAFWLVAPFVLALLLVLWAAMKALKYRKTEEALPASVDFDKSFASGITAIGAVFGVILSSTVLPKETAILSKEGFAVLNLVFGVAVVVAGFIYLALQRVKWAPPADDGADKAGQQAEGNDQQAPNNPKPEPKPTFEGSVVAFIAACVITVWAVLGELALTFLLILELVGAKGFNATAEVAMFVLMAGSVVLVAMYVRTRLLYALADTPEEDSAGLSHGILGGVTITAERRSVSLL